MEILQLLGIAVGLASLAGLNLYLTVFATGLAVRFHWIVLAPDYARLEVLGDPWVLGVSGVLCLMEFLADKLPWVDSLWDAVHTAIRPVGAAFLAILVLGDANPVFDVVVGLLAAWLGFTTHALKATVRLHANASPEPVSNVSLSIVEDISVMAGVGLIFAYPLIALGVAVVFVAAIWYFVPRMLRATWVKMWLCGQKLRIPADVVPPNGLPLDLPMGVKSSVLSAAGAGAEIVWSISCITGKGTGYPANRFGWLVATRGGGGIYFVFRGHRRRPRLLFSGWPAAARLEHKFLADVLVIDWPGGRSQSRFLFERGSRELAELVVNEITRISDESVSEVVPAADL